MNEDDCIKCSWYMNYICNCPYDSCSFEEYRPFTYTKEELEQLKHNIYNQAIDELMETVKNKYACFRTSNWWQCEQKCATCDCGAVRVSDIEQTVEQLKEKKNEL